MFILTSDPRLNEHLFTSEAFAVEALVLGGKEFVKLIQSKIDLIPSDKKTICIKQINELSKGLDKIQNVSQFNLLINQLTKTTLIKELGNRILPEEFISVFFGPADDEMFPSFTVTSLNWIIKELKENELISPEFSKIQKLFSKGLVETNFRSSFYP